MSNTLMNLYVKFQGLKNGEEGQDLVEYALLVALIALVCVTSISGVANAINSVFSQHQLVAGVTQGSIRCRETLPGRNSPRQTLRG